MEEYHGCEGKNIFLSEVTKRSYKKTSPLQWIPVDKPCMESIQYLYYQNYEYDDKYFTSQVNTY
jgi:hypothetical protein